MADILLDEQSNPATPSAGQHVVWPDSTTSIMAGKTDGGRNYMLHPRTVDAYLTADQTTVAATDTYVTGSGIQIPNFGAHVGMQFIWMVAVTKTAAGTVAPIVQIRTGTNKSTADTSRLTLTGTTAQAATAGSGILTVLCTVRTVGASGVIHGTFGIGGAPSLGNGVGGASATFDTTTALAAGQYIGISINPNTGATWTFHSCHARLEG